MSMDKATVNQVRDLLEHFDTQLLALNALSSLLCGNNQPTSIVPSELTYLLDPIIDQSRSVLKQMWSVLDDAEPVKLHTVKS